MAQPMKRQRKRKLRTAQLSSSPSSSASPASSSSAASSRSDSESDLASASDRESDVEHKSSEVPKDERSRSESLRPDHRAEDPSIEQENVVQDLSSLDSDEGEKGEDQNGQQLSNGTGNIEKIGRTAQEFEAWYLQTITHQYGNELDQLRNAADFKESSVPILIWALKQGVEMFSEADRQIVMQAVARKKAEP